MQISWPHTSRETWRSPEKYDADTLRTKTLRVKKKLDPHTVEILEDVDSLTREHGLQYLVIGALARELVIDHVLQMGAKATRDVDFAIAVQNWDEFSSIKEALLATARYSAPRHHPHRLNHIASNWQVDIIPFDGVQNAEGTIAWPPEMAIVMNVTGLTDALRSALRIEVADGLEIPVASVPAFFILKIFAWNDRRRETSKDADDLWRILAQYADIGNQDRLYDQFTEVLVAKDYDIKRAGAYLLGFDIASIAASETMLQLQRLLAFAGTRRLASDIAAARRSDTSALELSEALLADLVDGMQHQSQRT